MNVRMMKYRVWAYLRSNSKFTNHALMMKFRSEICYESVLKYLRLLRKEEYIWADPLANRRGKFFIDAPQFLVKNTGIFAPYWRGDCLFDPNLNPESHPLCQQIWSTLRQGEPVSLLDIYPPEATKGRKDSVNAYLRNLCRVELVDESRGKYRLISDLGAIAPEFVRGKMVDLNKL
jgi:hypothetical protein